MFRKIDDHKHTAAISRDGQTVTFMYDDGWENLLNCRMSFANEAEARRYLAQGWEEYDPNESLKAAGMVWNGYCYALPEKKADAA